MTELLLLLFGILPPAGVARAEYAAIVRASRDPWLQGGDQ